VTIKVIVKNRKARFQYFLLDHYEAGLELKGSEIKSIRAGQVSLNEAYVRLDGKEAWLVNAHIAPYESANRFNHEPRRERRLLLHKREIRKIWDTVRQKGVTVIPVKLYLKNEIAKIDIAIAKGKKLHDKRAVIAKREQERELNRQIRGRTRGTK
jgi:SsrA-binding protein